MSETNFLTITCKSGAFEANPGLAQRMANVQVLASSRSRTCLVARFIAFHLPHAAAATAARRSGRPNTHCAPPRPWALTTFAAEWPRSRHWRRKRRYDIEPMTYRRRTMGWPESNPSSGIPADPVRLRKVLIRQTFRRTGSEIVAPDLS